MRPTLTFHQKLSQDLLQHELLHQYPPEDENVNFQLLYSSSEYPYPPQGKSMEILGGWGLSKAKIFKGKYGV